MRRIVLMSLVVWLVFGAVEAAADEPLRAAASFAIIADFVQQVGGDRVEVVSLVPALADPTLGSQPLRRPGILPVLFCLSTAPATKSGCGIWCAALLNQIWCGMSAGLEPLPGPSHSVHSDHRHDPHFWLSVANSAHVERIAQTLWS